MIANPEYGQILNYDSPPFFSVNGDRFEPIFETLAEAEAEKDRLLSKLPYVEVLMTNLENKEIKNFYNEEIQALYLQERQVYLTWLALPFYKKLFRKKPEAIYFKR